MEIGVYGLGRFGFFWSSLLARHFEVKAFSRNRTRRIPRGVKRVSENELIELPVLFLCVAISAVEEVVRRIAGGVKPGALIMDTCSVKAYPAAVMEKHLPSHAEILATHPMFGPDSAHAGLSGLPMILCPIRISEHRFDEWKTFFSSQGLRVLTMSPDRHDYTAAFTQGITHYVGRVLSDLGIDESDMATLGYRKLLEIKEQTCNDSWQLFLDLQRYNPYTEEMRNRLHRSVETILSKLGAYPESYRKKREKGD
jgi:prephenate dehydrogenase